MIVKNESHIVQEALNSLKNYIDYYVVCDTGSSDGTQGIIRKWGADACVEGVVLDHEWKNFGHNRTMAFHEAFTRYETHKCDYLLMFDADDIIEGTFPRDTLLTSTADALYLRVGKGFVYDRLCIFYIGSGLQWKYVGVLHEFPECINKECVTTEHISGDYYIESRRIGSRNTLENKYVNDTELLMKAIEGEKDEGITRRYIFYAAQSLYDAGKSEEAKKYYGKRMQLGGWQEEVYYSAFRIAVITATNGAETTDIETAYLTAYKEAPHRAEPLHALSRFYREKNDFKSAYAFAKLAQSILSPLTNAPQDIHLFISQSVYDYQVDDELAISAYYVGKKDECRQLCEKILRRPDLSDDDRQRISNNLAFCI